MKNNPLHISHTILYAKGWYMESEDLINDLAKMLKRDGYICCKTKNDVSEILKTAFDNWNEWLRETSKSYYSIGAFLDKVNDEMRIARLYDIELDYQTAIIRTILSIFRFKNSNVLNLGIPIYDKIYMPNPEIEWIKPGCTYKYANSRIKKVFENFSK